jgi:uncharacterized SAM-binding protein YcdF (DUF218 family)
MVPDPMIVPSRLLRRVVLAGAIVLTAALLLAPPALRMAGRFLVVQDELRPAGAIVVFGGGLPYRAIEAARLYDQGWAKEIWVTRGGRDGPVLALRRLGITQPREHEISQMVLERHGIQAAAIRILPRTAINTVEEVRAVADAAEAVGALPIIVVTSKPHTRRVKLIWKTVAPGRDLVVRYGDDDDFEPAAWYRNTSDAKSVAWEWLGIGNALLGFPVGPKSEAP